MRKVAVILAGGKGERLFPLSTNSKPKQFLNLYNEKSLLENTFDRLLKIFDKEDIFVIGRIEDKSILYEQLFDKINMDNIILEHASLNTAFSILFSTYVIKEKLGDVIINVFSSDHYIKNENEYIDIINKVNENVEDKIILLGVKPTYPSTQFGYIKTSDNLNQIKSVESFMEKPSLDKAKEYIKNNYLWNSGTFIFKTDTMLNEFNKYLPEYIKYFNEYFIYKTISMLELISFLKPVSIDKGIIEKSDKILCMKLDAGWMDIGNYNSLDSVLEHDQNNNSINENANYVDCNNCMVIGNKENVIIMDVNDLIVSVNDGKILIMKKTSDILKLRRIRWLIYIFILQGLMGVDR